MKFLAVSTNVDDPMPYLAAESARVGELIEDGTIEQLFLKADWSGSVIIVHAGDQLTAQSALDSLPLVCHGVTTFDVTEIVAPPPMGPIPA